MSKHPFQNFTVRFASGDQIFCEEEEGRTMYIVQSGRVEMYRELQDEKRVLGVMEKGDFFGEMSILEGLPRTNSAQAIEDCELVEINSGTFDKMIRGNIEIAVRMLRKLSIRLREAERKIGSLQPMGQRNAPLPSAHDAKRPGPVASGARLQPGDDDGAALALCAQETLIGRYDPVTEQRPDIDLTELDLKRSVSRRHARIVHNDDGYVILEEVGALNGTFVNGEQLVTGQACPLADGDRIGVGTVTLVFHT